MPAKKPQPFHILCAQSGSCGFDRAYIMGRIDEREGRPDLGARWQQLRAHHPQKLAHLLASTCAENNVEPDTRVEAALLLLLDSLQLQARHEGAVAARSRARIVRQLRALTLP